MLRLQPWFVNKSRKHVFFRFYFKVILLSHIPFQLPGFEIQQVTGDGNRFSITAAAQSSAAICPSCGQNSQRIHSYYIRKPRDLAISGQAVQLNLHVRRFRCQNQDCRRKTFAERLPEVVP